MSPRLRSVLVYAAIVCVVFIGTLVASFVYTREPRRDTVSVSVDASPTAAAAAVRTVSGTVDAVAPGTLRIRTQQGEVTVALPASVPVVALERVTGSGAPPFAVGTHVNVGGEKTSSGLVLSGVVAVEAGAP